MIKMTATIEIKYTYEGTELARARESLGLSQARFSEITGISQPHICQYERPGPVTIRELTKKAFEKAGIIFGKENM